MSVMPVTDQSFYDQHNRFQCDYFEGGPKKTMVPRASPYLERHIDEALIAGQITKSDRIIDVGCGMGRYTLLMAERGLRVEGLDMSAVLIDRLREYGGARLNVPLHVADVINPPQELIGAYDVVIGYFVLHHIHDLPPSFAGMTRMLKPGGRMVFVEPNPYNPLYYVQIAITPGMRWQGERGIVNMRRRVIRDACERAGLVDFELRRFGFFPPFITNKPAGRAVERVLERLPVWRPALPTQLFTARRP